MRKILVVLAFLCPALSMAATSETVRNVYPTNNVTTSAWKQLVSSLGGVIGHVDIFDSSGNTMVLGAGAPGSEVTVLTIPPGGGSFPLNISKGAAISIKGVSSTATNVGEIDINFFYR